MKKHIFPILLFLAVFSGCMPVDESTPYETSAALSTGISETELMSEAAVQPEEKDPAEEILAEMSLEEKIGQVILVRYPDSAADMAEKYHFGGYTLYAKDFENETPESLAAKLDEVRAKTKLPPFIAADEEGGEIVRASKYKAFAEEPLPSLQKALSESITMTELAEQTADVLKKAGVNLHLAPVADVAENPSDYIYSRTCGLDYQGTAEVIGELAGEMNRQGIMCCLKHFPGYGSNVDTHTGIAVDSRERTDFESKDFLPFKAGIKAGAPMVMVNHNIVTAYNADMPASLAPEVHSALRGLGFEGIIITDDLGMDAISEYTSDPYGAAFLAGNDMLCTSDGAACFNALLEAVNSGAVSEQRLDESVLRILRAKIKYGIIK